MSHFIGWQWSPALLWWYIVSLIVNALQRMFSTRNLLSNLLFLFVCGFSSHSRIFHLYGDVTITGEGVQILTHTQHSWPLSSEGSLACHTYCDISLEWSSPRTCDTHTCCRAFGSGAVTTCFHDLGVLPLTFEIATFRMRCERSNPLRDGGGLRYGGILLSLFMHTR